MSAPTISANQLEKELAAIRAQSTMSIALVDLLTTLANHRDVPMEQRLAAAQEATELAKQLNYEHGQLRGLLEQIRLYVQRTRGDLALPLTQEAQTLLAAVSDDRLAADVYFQIGMAYHYLGEYASSLQAFSAALAAYRRVSDPVGEGDTLNMFGLTYERLGEYLQAIALFEQTLSLAQATGNQRIQAMVLNNLAVNFTRIGEYSRARDMAEASLAVCEAMRATTAHVRGYAYTLDTMADILYCMGDLDIAEEYAQRARAENRLPDGSPRYADLESDVLLDLGKIYRKRGAWEQAGAVYEEALAFSTAAGLRHTQLTALQALAEVHEAQGMVKPALGYLKAFARLRAELFTSESQQRIRNFQVVLETERARREAALLQQRNQELQQAIATLEQTKQALHTAVSDMQRRTVEMEGLLAENTQQRQTIRALSVPVLPLSAEVLVMPLVGVLDDELLHHVQEQALFVVQKTGADYILLDITGVSLVDTRVAQGLMRTVRAARMLGAHVLLIGIRPEVAQTIVNLGLALDGVQTTATLQTALQQLGLIHSLRKGHYGIS